MRIFSQVTFRPKHAGCRPASSAGIKEGGEAGGGQKNLWSTYSTGGIITNKAFYINYDEGCSEELLGGNVQCQNLITR